MKDLLRDSYGFRDIYKPWMEIIEDKCVNDNETVKRNWKERIFSRPWNPLKKTKVLYKPKVFLMLDKYLVCSPKTANMIRAAVA